LIKDCFEKLINEPEKYVIQARLLFQFTSVFIGKKDSRKLRPIFVGELLLQVLHKFVLRELEPIPIAE